MSLPSKIPDNEIDNLMDIYWQMLVTLESKCDPKKDLLDKNLVEAGYKVLNRIACFNKGDNFWCKEYQAVNDSIKSDHKPAWA
jgi:putative ribosome biogenesis GTPase RsgA